MKYLFILFIIWSIFRSFQKAAKKQNERKRDSQSRRVVGSLGAVHEQPDMDSFIVQDTPVSQNSTLPTGDDDKARWAALQADAAQFLSTGRMPATPSAVETPILSPLPALTLDQTNSLAATETRRDMHEAYQEHTLVRRGIRLDRESLRTFFVTREILGTPRSRARFRSGFRK